MLTLFNGDFDATLGERAIFFLLEALAKIDIDYLDRYPSTPALYASGVRYERQKGDQEDWHDIPTAIATGKTDCKVLSAWRIAELRRSGVAARPFLLRQQSDDGKYLYHVQVEWPDGTIEDPSKVLGMASAF
jgi:hypothetical protein